MYGAPVVLLFFVVSVWFCVQWSWLFFFFFSCWRNVEIISFSMIDGFFNFRGKLNRAAGSAAISRWDQNNLMLGTEMICCLAAGLWSVCFHFTFIPRI
jgi:hypothetical protein